MLRFCALVILATVTVTADDFQGSTHITSFDEDTIAYSKTEADGPIPRLQKRIEKGQVKLPFDSEHGFLTALLRELKVDTNSQMLVFSKTSFQRDRISPANPRALYFNDDVYIGYIHGSPVLEVTSVDPKLGAVFYTVAQQRGSIPKFTRTDQCLECHASTKSLGVPGHLIRSFACDDNGSVDLTRGTLSEFFAAEEYPAASSDIVALMVLEHQSHMHNYLTRMNYEARIALQQFGHLNYLKSKVDAFLRYMLFTDEIALAKPVKGNTQFSKNFSARGPKDKQGRSLRDCDLQTRLFKYPCSYLIYSEAFDALPSQLKDVLYNRLWDILNGDDANADFKKIPVETRTAVREILVQTKPGLPNYWK